MVSHSRAKASLQGLGKVKEAFIRISDKGGALWRNGCNINLSQIICLTIGHEG